jgi:hypothetical protein
MDWTSVDLQLVVKWTQPRKSYKRILGKQAAFNSYTISSKDPFLQRRKVDIPELTVNHHAYQTKHRTGCFREECGACNQIVLVVILNRIRTSIFLKNKDSKYGEKNCTTYKSRGNSQVKANEKISHFRKKHRFHTFNLFTKQDCH